MRTGWYGVCCVAAGEGVMIIYHNLELNLATGCVIAAVVGIIAMYAGEWMDG